MTDDIVERAVQAEAAKAASAVPLRQAHRRVALELAQGEQLNPDAVFRLCKLDGTTWEIAGPPVWEMHFHSKGQYDPSYRVPVTQVIA